MNTAPKIRKKAGHSRISDVKLEKREDMRRYWYELEDEHCNDPSVFIPDGSDKETAVGHARRWMKKNGVKAARLIVYSMRTDNLIDVIDIEV